MEIAEIKEKLFALVNSLEEMEANVDKCSTIMDALNPTGEEVTKFYVRDHLNSCVGYANTIVNFMTQTRGMVMTAKQIVRGAEEKFLLKRIEMLRALSDEERKGLTEKERMMIAESKCGSVKEMYYTCRDVYDSARGLLETFCDKWNNLRLIHKSLLGQVGTLKGEDSMESDNWNKAAGRLGANY